MSCTPNHDWFTNVLTFGLCCGLIISYAPQHLRIINKGSSEGFSPWFLLLGCTSSAAGMLNMITMQWGIVKCCQYVSLGSCLEITAGVVQLGLQWALFNFIYVLFVTYYPPPLKYTEIPFEAHDSRPRHSRIKAPEMRSEWRMSVILGWTVVAHLVICTLITIILLGSAPSSPDPKNPLPRNVSQWATFLGVSSALLSAIQYAPQLVHTYRMKLVGALSIPMMLIQSPGAVLMVLSIALRPGTNWTSWITFAVAGIMQGALLIMCIFWKLRQSRLEVDDFGHPLSRIMIESEFEGGVPGLVVGGDEDPVAVQVALANALESAVEETMDVPALESTPLLQNPDVTPAKAQISSGLFGWLRKE